MTCNKVFWFLKIIQSIILIFSRQHPFHTHTNIKYIIQYYQLLPLESQSSGKLISCRIYFAPNSHRNDDHRIYLRYKWRDYQLWFLPKRHIHGVLYFNFSKNQQHCYIIILYPFYIHVVQHRYKIHHLTLHLCAIQLT